MQAGAVGALIVACAVVLGCGKKGPPLAPVLLVPAAVGEIAARRVADDVFLAIRLPQQNMDGSTPVDIGRVEVYGYRGSAAPPVARFTDQARLVAEVRPDRGASAVTVHDRVAATPAPPAGADAPGPPATGVASPTATVASLYYLVVPFSARGRAGPPSRIVEVSLEAAPPPPTEITAGFTADTVTLSWAVPGRGPASPMRFNVYLEADTASGSDQPVAPTPLNEAPLEVASFSAGLEVDGRRRCYTVRSVEGTGAAAVEGRAATPACIVPIDVFPPAAPSGLAASAGGEGISLIWEPVAAADLAGYVVLRAEAGDDTLTPVTGAVVTETRFTDREVRAGVRYTYAVTAVDGRQPPNVSVPSARVEATAR